MSELDELVRKRRFDEIYEARKQVREDKRNLDDALATGAVSDSMARRLYQRSVDRYVQQLETLLNPPVKEDEDHEPSPYWTDVTIGTIDLPDGSAIEVNGLLGYLDLDEEIGVRVRVGSQDRYFEVQQEQVETHTVQPSWRLLESAVRTANTALADLGLEINPTEEGDNLYMIKNDPDDYKQPVKDGINKPKPPN